MRLRIFLYISVFALIMCSPSISLGYSENECVECHRLDSSLSKLHIDIERYSASMHGREISCMDCHAAIEDESHTVPKFSEIVDCGGCHEQSNLHSADGSVTCADCHTKHYVFQGDDPRSSVNRENTGETCGKCHPDQIQNKGLLDILVSIQILSHPKQDFSGDFDNNMCSGCHQGKAAHGEDSRINNLNCDTCHMELEKRNSLLGYIHPVAHNRDQPVNRIAGYINIIGLVASIVLLFIIVLRFAILNKQ